MTTPTLTVQNLFDAESAALKLKWVAGRNGSQRLLEPGNAKFPGMALVGHLNFVHPNRVQVIGGAEMHYLERLGKGERADALQQLFSCDRTAAVIVCRDRQPTADFK
ncbi:MAG: HPr kinase/phosphorylase, partial [Pseudomonadota bacterium]